MASSSGQDNTNVGSSNPEVSQDQTRTTLPKKRVLKSPAWDFFDHTGDEATCKKCKHTYQHRKVGVRVH